MTVSVTATQATQQPMEAMCPPTFNHGPKRQAVAVYESLVPACSAFGHFVWVCSRYWLSQVKSRASVDTDSQIITKNQTYISYSHNTQV